LLFSAGKRPTRAALRDFAEAQTSVSLTHDPTDDRFLHLVKGDSAETGGGAFGEIQPDIAERVWVELLREGLTFDLVGLAQGPECDFPVIEFPIGLQKTPSAFRYEALYLAPGQHLAGGRRTMPVVKGLVGLARDLIHHFEGLEAVVWPVAQSAIGRRFFESTATEWLEGGTFPALGLTAFRANKDGSIQSVGLDFWIGQELRFEPPLSNDRVAATRLGVRLINQLVLTGGLKRDEGIVAPDGSRLTLSLSENRKYIRVWPG